MIEKISPRCELITESSRYRRIAMRSLRFDFTDLILEVQGSNFSFAQVIFRNPSGFRVLDERDLCEFWPEHSEPKGWLWEVHSGGWADLESQRSHFSSPSVLSPLREFFVVGDDCLSVLCNKSPEIIDLGAAPDHA